MEQETEQQEEILGNQPEPSLIEDNQPEPQEGSVEGTDGGEPEQPPVYYTDEELLTLGDKADITKIHPSIRAKWTALEKGYQAKYQDFANRKKELEAEKERYQQASFEQLLRDDPVKAYIQNPQEIDRRFDVQIQAFENKGEPIEAQRLREGRDYLQKEAQNERIRRLETQNTTNRLKFEAQVLLQEKIPNIGIRKQELINFINTKIGFDPAQVNQLFENPYLVPIVEKLNNLYIELYPDKALAGKERKFSNMKVITGGSGRENEPLSSERIEKMDMGAYKRFRVKYPEL